MRQSQGNFTIRSLWACRRLATGAVYGGITISYPTLWERLSRFLISEFVVNGDHAIELFFALDAFELELFFALFFGFCTLKAALFFGDVFEFALGLAFFALLVPDEAAFLGFLIALFARVAGVGALDDAQEGGDLIVGFDQRGLGHAGE